MNKLLCRSNCDNLWFEALLRLSLGVKLQTILDGLIDEILLDADSAVRLKSKKHFLGLLIFSSDFSPLQFPSEIS